MEEKDFRESIINEERDRKKALDAGCDDYLAKPFEAKDLLEKISTLLNR